MSHTNTSYRLLASLIFATFIANTLAPTLQFAFADSTQYYVDATGGSDVSDGLTPATAWQTLTHVNSQSFLQGDTIHLKCGEIWSEAINSIESGNPGLPITYDSYGTCTGSNDPRVQSIDLNGSNYVNFDSLDILAPTGTALSLVSGSDIVISNSRITSSDAASLVLSGVTNTTITDNVFPSGVIGITLDNSSTNIQGNTFSNISNDVIMMNSTLANTIHNNHFIDLPQGAIVFTENTTISQNDFYNICTIGGQNCAAIRNSTSIPSGANVGVIISQNSLKNIGSGIVGGNRGIKISSIDNVTLSSNNIENAETAIDLIDASNIGTTNNVITFARKNSYASTQLNPGIVMGNILDGNTLFQKNLDYPYIEIRDEVPGSGVASLVTANGNNFITLYKPDTSYVRSVKFGGETIEYATKNSLNLFDPANTKFQNFGYKPYTSTGNYATANLLSNPDFVTNVSGWTSTALAGAIPLLSHNLSGSYIGGSLSYVPQDTTPDHMWLTNDALLSITSGQVYEVTGYLRSSTGSINVRAFLHQSGDKNTIYSDRIAEVSATATGGVFRFYITATNTASDAQFTLETSNQNIDLEVDSMSLRRKTIVLKNTDPNEVFVFTNTGSSDIFQACPGGVPCAQYVDRTNATIGWPGSNLNVPAYSTRIALWNNSSNILAVPVVSVIIDSGSIPSGTNAHVSWSITGSVTNGITYTTATGTINQSIANFGDIYFEPPAGATTTTYIYTENEIGPRVNSVDVTTTNTPPVVYPVTLVGNEDDSTIVGTLSGVDFNPGDSVFFEKFTDPSVGTILVNLSGTATYLPNPDFCGITTFGYRAYDQYSNFADPINATVQITCINDAPTAVNDSFTVTGSVTTFDTLSNDTDIDSIYEAQSFFLSGFTQPAHGTVTIIGNNFEYAVNGGYIGSDSFTYSMVDQSGALSNTGTINISVTIPNTPPTDASASYTTSEDQVLSNVLSGSDINPDTLSFSASVLPTNGSLSVLANGNFTYTPNANFNGTDSFIYQVFDGSAYSSGAQIDITVTSVDDAPVAVNDAYALVQDTTLIVPVLNNDTDVDSIPANLTLTGFMTATHGTVTPSGTGLLYTPNAGYSGSDSFTYRIVDETSLLSNSATVSLTITPSNTAPIVSDLSFSLNEDGSLTQTLSGADPEMSTLTYLIDTLPTNGTFSLSATGVFIYTPNANFHGVDSFTVHANDGILNSAIATITLTVNSVNDIPTVSDAMYTLSGNSYASSGNIFVQNLIGADIDSSILTFSSSLLPLHGLLSITSTGVFSYTAAYGYTGTDSFTYHITDEHGGVSLPATVLITVVGMNAAPVAVSDVFTTGEDTMTSFTLSGSDPDLTPVTFILDAGVSTGTLSLLPSGNVTYTPALNATGTVSFTYHVTDGQLSSSVETVIINVTPVNDAPQGSAAIYSVLDNTLMSSGNILTGTLSALDIDSPVLSFTLATLPSHGNINLTSTGYFEYIPDIGYIGNDTFTYLAHDGLLSSTPISVNITVGVIVPPVVIGPQSGPGGGGGGGSVGGSASVDIFSSAPSTQGSSMQSVTYMGMAAEGLAAQLFLVNRVLISSGSSVSIVSGEIYPAAESIATGSVLAPSLLDQLFDELSTNEDPAYLLRKIVRIVMNTGEVTQDPRELYMSATKSIQDIDTQDDIRLTLTQEYALRILQLQSKKYEEIINRNLNTNLSAAPEEDMEYMPVNLGD